MAARAAASPLISKTSVFSWPAWVAAVEASGPSLWKGVVVSRDTLDVGHTDRPLAMLDNGDTLSLLGSSLAESGSSSADFFVASVTEQGQFPSLERFNVLGASGFSFLNSFDGVVAKAEGSSFILGTSLRKQQDPALTRPALFAVRSNGTLIESFGEAGVFQLGYAPEVWTSVVSTPWGVAVLGWQEDDEAQVPLLTVINPTTGKVLSPFASEGFVRLAANAGFRPVLAAVDDAGDLVVAGVSGSDGGNLFVGRFQLRALLEQ